MSTKPQLGWTRAGAGEPLLLLHGIGTTRDDFSALIPRLAADYDVLALDLPDHGESAALTSRPTVEALADAVEADLDAHGLDRVHVLGNSLGGRLALELATRHRALSVVAIAPSGLALPPERLHQGALLTTTRLVTRRIRSLIGPLSRSRIGRTVLLGGLRARPWDASPVEARAMRTGFAETEDFFRTMWWSTLADLPRDLRAVDCPVILAQGTADVVALAQTPRYLMMVPGAQFVPLFGAGHAPQSDSPDEIVRIVREATAQVRRRTAATAARS